ncbi:MAG: DNA internalization-related competence protein ComEC/Rec2 [Pseudomonadota bacterium]
MTALLGGLIGGVLMMSMLPVLSPFILLALGAAFVCLLCLKGLARFGMGGAILGVVLGGVFAADYDARRLPTSCSGQTVRVTGRVDGLPVQQRRFQGSQQQRFVLDVVSIEPRACAGPERLALSYYGGQRVVAGEWLALDARLRRPWGLANPGAYNAQVSYARRGIDAVGAVRKRVPLAHAVEPGRLASGRWRTLHHSLRERVRRGLIESISDPRARSVLLALTIGDSAAIDDTLWRVFQSLGITHLLVVSGLHVGLVAGLGFAFGYLLQRLCPVSHSSARAIACLLALVSACAYAALAGFSLPTQRALYMLNCAILASLLTRRAGAVQPLLLAAAMILSVNPLAALGSGFWLSFGAVCALLWWSAWRARPSAVSWLTTQTYMGLVMVPLGGWFFGGASLLSVVANGLLIPLIGLLVVPLALLGVAAFAVDWSVFRGLWGGAALILEFLLPWLENWVAESHDRIFRSIHLPAASLPAALIAVTLLAVPAAVVRLVGFMVILPFLVVRPTSTITPGTTRVTVLDVGQGTAVVIQAEGRALVYDTGGGDPDGNNMARRVVLPYLKQQGVRALDTLVISHPDRDHSAGAVALLSALPVARLRYGERPAGVYSGRRCRSGETFRWPGGQVFRFLAPANEPHLDSNNGSCVLQVTLGASRLLLPGDIDRSRERSLLRYWPDLVSDWLLVAHHGSGSSSSWTWLKRVRPRQAVYTYGYANRFGHPHPDVVRRLEALGAEQYATAHGGALVFDFHSSGTQKAVQKREKLRFYWM